MKNVINSVKWNKRFISAKAVIGSSVFNVYGLAIPGVWLPIEVITEQVQHNLVVELANKKTGP